MRRLCSKSLHALELLSRKNFFTYTTYVKFNSSILKIYFPMKRSLFILAAVLILSSGGNVIATGFDTTYSRILQTKIEQLKLNYSLVGISAAAYVPGQGIWKGAAGISSSDSDKMTAEMVFGSGSITKNWIAAIILQLEEADSLNISDSLGKWLPQYQNIPGNITLKQLMDHSSGIYNVTDNQVFINAIFNDLKRLWTIQEVLEGGYVLQPYFSPGTSFHYSNTNYMILGLIISKIMHTTLAEQFRQRFFIPFNLTESYFEIDDTVKSPIAHNWSDIGNGVEDIFYLPVTSFNSSTIGAGGVICTPENLIRYAGALFEGRIIGSNSLTKMLTFRPVSIAGANGYGLGTMRYNILGISCYGHGGNSWGYSSVMIYNPADSISIAIMTNKDINAAPIGISFIQSVMQNNPSGIISINNQIPDKFALNQNYPNPFNPVTSIDFRIMKKENATLSVFNALGQEIEILFKGELKEGTYSFKWDASGMVSGIYFYKLATSDYSETRKMILIK